MQSRFPARPALLAVLSCFAAAVPADAPLPLNVQAMLKNITANELRGDLSFLASDVMKGRYTPSPELDIAAEFIAAKFRAAGLQPAGDREYFQIAAMVDRRWPALQTEMTVWDGSTTIHIPADAMALVHASQAATIERAPVLFVETKDPDNLKDADLKGKAIVTRQPDWDKLAGEDRRRLRERVLAFDRAVANSDAAVEITLIPTKPHSQNPQLISEQEAQQRRVPDVHVRSEELEKLTGTTAQAEDKTTVSLEIPGPEDKQIQVRNVVGILRGSDATLRQTCVMLSAHYDHIGTTETAGEMTRETPGFDSTDRIYNGANDDGSGTVSVIEIARVLAKLPVAPRRSIVFAAFFGEERGELGSGFYAAHPAFPLDKTVADVNLEQLGRTDSTEGKQIDTMTLTGYDYSGITKFFERAGKKTNVKVYRDPASDEYFSLSDNYPLAEHGVPAETIAVAFDYPDYHGLGDEWQKIDYENMARVDRSVALGLLDIANSGHAPEWNVRNEATQPYREARKRHP